MELGGLLLPYQAHSKTVALLDMSHDCAAVSRPVIELQLQ
jgi:hypothetical protein